MPPAPGAASAPERVPVLRGLLHAYAAWVALAGAVALVVLAPERDARLAAAVYGAGLCALFGVSALYHRWRGDRRWRPLLRRLDHSTIYLFIAATTTPVALLVLSGTLRVVVLATVWAGALGGVVLSVAWPRAPRALIVCSYVGVGWAGAAGIPQMIDRLPAPPVALLAAGGLLYTAGAVVYAARRPDPWPRTFGFHEIFHGLVVVAAAAHFVAMAGWIVPGGTA